ncbi:MAG: hypothetical protein U0263_19945 [Polyangiaceae bacterium]
MLRHAVLAFVLTACSADSEGGTASNAGGSTASGGSGGSNASGGAGAGGGGGSSASGGNLSGGTGGGLDLDASFQPIAVRALPGLQSISFYERTGGTAPTEYDFSVNGPELSQKLVDPLSDTNKDILGASSEWYDVYYSDQDGSFDLDGSYLTISGVFLHPLPAGGGLNLAEIGLHFSGSQTEYGNYVASYVVLGDNKVEADVGKCIDGDLQTHTTMGNTVGSTERLRLTLGFKSTSGPPK